MANEIFTNILHLAATKRCTVVEPSIQDPRLPCQQFNQLPHLTHTITHTCTHTFIACNVLRFTLGPADGVGEIRCNV